MENRQRFNGSESGGFLHEVFHSGAVSFFFSDSLFTFD